MAHPHSQEWAGLLRRALAVMLSGALLVIQQGSSIEALAGAAASAKAAKAGTGGLRAPGGVSGVPNGVAGRVGSLSGSVTLKPGLNGVLSSAGPSLRPSVAPAAAAQVTLPAASAAPAESISRPAVHSTLNRDRGTRVFAAPEVEPAAAPYAAAPAPGSRAPLAARSGEARGAAGSLRALGRKLASAPAATMRLFFDRGVQDGAEAAAAPAAAASQGLAPGRSQLQRLEEGEDGSEDYGKPAVPAPAGDKSPAAGVKDKPKWIEFRPELLKHVKEALVSSLTRPNKQDYTYLVTKTFGVNLAVRLFFVIQGVTGGTLPLMRAMLSTAWYQVQDAVFTVFGQTYMKFLGKMTGLLRIRNAQVGDFIFIYGQLVVFEFLNRLVLGPLGENPLVYTLPGLSLIFVNILQGMIAGGPLVPAINKMHKAGVISEKTMMHFYQISSLTMHLGLFASFGFQTIYHVLTAIVAVISWGLYLYFSFRYGNAEALPAAETKLALGAAIEEGEKSGVVEEQGRERPRAPDSLAEASLELDPARKYHPSPEDWRDEIFYLMMVDRFAKSKNGRPVGDPKQGGTRHGGDIRGIIEKLDYLQKAGVTTLVMTPVTETQPEAYHGYATFHYLDIDPHLGTLEDFRELVREAHKRGLRVLLDIVLNHTGPVFDYEDGDRDGTPWEGRERKTVWTRELKPAELSRDEHFTRMGKIRDWNDPAQATRGDFPPNYRHLATDRPRTQELLIKVAKYWMKETDIDGFRLDAIRHADAGFWQRFSREIREYAGTMGKANFLLLGENSTGRDEDVRDNLAAGAFDTLYNYPAYRRENYALHGRAPARALAESYERSQAALGAAAGRLLRFIDLHDTYRFLRTREPQAALHAALAFLLFADGIPLVYYGTEQAFRQDVQSLDPEGPHLPADPANREDMFADGQFKSDSSAGDKFDRNSPTFRWFARLAELRKRHPALRRGAQWIRWADPQGAGLFAFSRIHEGQEVLVVINTAREPRSATMWVDSGITPAGTELVDELDPSYSLSARAPPQGGAQVTLEVPPNGVRVLVRARR